MEPSAPWWWWWFSALDQFNRSDVNDVLNVSSRKMLSVVGVHFKQGILTSVWVLPSASVVLHEYKICSRHVHLHSYNTPTALSILHSSIMYHTLEWTILLLSLRVPLHLIHRHPAGMAPMLSLWFNLDSLTAIVADQYFPVWTIIPVYLVTKLVEPQNQSTYIKRPARGLPNPHCAPWWSDDPSYTPGILPFSTAVLI